MTRYSSAFCTQRLNMHRVCASTVPFEERSEILFIGGFDHLPNVDAMLWFCRDIWPLVRQKLSGIRMNIVGQNFLTSAMCVGCL